MVTLRSVSLREIPRRGTKLICMYFVYFLKSRINSDLYVGSTENVEKRLARHNGGRVKSTKAYRPWILLGYLQYKTRGEAMSSERYYKTGQQKELLKDKYKDL